MIQTIIRAKTGLHAGATWRFDQSGVTIGASPKADVFLCDPDVPEELVTLKRSGRKYELINLNKDAHLTSGEEKKIEDVLFSGQSGTLTFRHVQLEIQAVRTTFGPLAALSERCSVFFYSLLYFLRQLGAKAVVAALFMISLAMTTLVLFFGTAGVAKSEATPLKKESQKDASAQRKQAVIQVTERIARQAVEEFEQFAEVNKADDFSVQLQGQNIRIQGELSRYQIQRFEKELMQVNRDFGDKVSIHAEISLSQEQNKVDLLDIEQVMLGSHPVIILRDGSRLYIGGTYNDMSVIGIESDKVILKGESTYEVTL